MCLTLVCVHWHRVIYLAHASSLAHRLKIKDISIVQLVAGSFQLCWMEQECQPRAGDSHTDKSHAAPWLYTEATDGVWVSTELVTAANLRGVLLRNPCSHCSLVNVSRCWQLRLCSLFQCGEEAKLCRGLLPKYNTCSRFWALHWFLPKNVFFYFFCLVFCFLSVPHISRNESETVPLVLLALVVWLLNSEKRTWITSEQCICILCGLSYTWRK